MLNPTLTVEMGRIGSHLECGWQALTSEIVACLCENDSPPAFLLWGSKAQALFDACRPPASNLTVFRTRHPSNDFRREFMVEGSHFKATARLVDWWCLGNQGDASTVI